VSGHVFDFAIADFQMPFNWQVAYRKQQRFVPKSGFPRGNTKTTGKKEGRFWRGRCFDKLDTVEFQACCVRQHVIYTQNYSTLSCDDYHTTG